MSFFFPPQRMAYVSVVDKETFWTGCVYTTGICACYLIKMLKIYYVFQIGNQISCMGRKKDWSRGAWHVWFCALDNVQVFFFSLSLQKYYTMNTTFQSWTHYWFVEYAKMHWIHHSSFKRIISKNKKIKIFFLFLHLNPNIKV